MKRQGPVPLVAILSIVAPVACGTLAPARTPAASSPAAGPPEPNVLIELHEAYSFNPQECCDDYAESSDAKILNDLWVKAAREPSRYLPVIRTELAAAQEPPYFYFDAGGLLTKLSDAPADRELALAALERVDLHDLSPLTFVQRVNEFARSGLDTSSAAFKILSDPRFLPEIPERWYQLSHGDSLRFMLLPSDNPAILRAIFARYPNEENDFAKKALLMLAFDFAPDGDQLVREVAGNFEESVSVRAYAKTLAKQISNVARIQNATELIAFVFDDPRMTRPPADEVRRRILTTPLETLAARRRDAENISAQSLDAIDLDTMILRMQLAHGVRDAER